MPNQSTRKQHPHLRAAIEIAFIIFLFYSNLLMGEFNRTNRLHKTLLQAVHNIVTPQNLIIAIVTAVTAHLLFENLRKNL